MELAEFRGAVCAVFAILNSPCVGYMLQIAVQASLNNQSFQNQRCGAQRMFVRLSSLSPKGFATNQEACLVLMILAKDGVADTAALGAKVLSCVCLATIKVQRPCVVSLSCVCTRSRFLRTFAICGTTLKWRLCGRLQVSPLRPLATAFIAIGTDQHGGSETQRSCLWSYC